MKLNPFSYFGNKKSKSKSTKELEKKSNSNGGLTLEQVLSMTNEDYSKKLEVVYSCITDKAETAGMIPVHLFGPKGDQKTSGRTYDIFTQHPNDYMSMQELVELYMQWVERRGVFYAYKLKNEDGNTYSIVPFRFQDNVSPQMDTNGNVYYIYTTNEGKQKTTFDREDLFIVYGQTSDGFTPISPLIASAGLMETATAQESNYNSLQVNGITSQMGLGTDNIFQDENKLVKLQEDWKKFRGSKGFENVPIFENGLKPVSLSLTPAETELLKSREFTVNRICRVFRVPTHRAGVVGDGDIGNIFDLDEAYFRNSIVPKLKKFITELQKCLPRGYRVESNYNSFYSGSPWRMAEAVDKIVKGGLWAVGEGRVALGLKRVEGDDVFAINNNNVDYGKWTQLEEFRAQNAINKNQSNNTNNTEEVIEDDSSS